jgi:hypothetical protein
MAHGGTPLRSAIPGNGLNRAAQLLRLRLQLGVTSCPTLVLPTFGELTRHQRNCKSSALDRAMHASGQLRLRSCLWPMSAHRVILPDSTCDFSAPHWPAVTSLRVPGSRPGRAGRASARRVDRGAVEQRRGARDDATGERGCDDAGRDLTLGFRGGLRLEHHRQQGVARFRRRKRCEK